MRFTRRKTPEAQGSDVAAELAEAGSCRVEPGNQQISEEGCYGDIYH
jgi:hypothetical protein